MTITIRPARLTDTAAIRYVGTVAWPATYGADRGAAYVMSGLDAYWSAAAIDGAINDGNIDVAESEDGIVGMVQVEELGDDLVMWKLYVLPGQQRGGVGRRLVQSAKDRALRQGQDLLTEYEPSNERVRGFYLREGFEPTASPLAGTDAVWLRFTHGAEPSQGGTA